MADTLISRLRTPADSNGTRRDIHLKTIANAVHYGDSTKKLPTVLNELATADAVVDQALDTTETDCNNLITQETAMRIDGDNTIKNSFLNPMKANITDINKSLNTMVTFDEEEQPETDHKILWVKKDTIDPGEHPHEPWEPGEYEPDPDLPPYEIDPGPTVGPRDRIYGIKPSTFYSNLFCTMLNIDTGEQIYDPSVPIRRRADFDINAEGTIIEGKGAYEGERYPLRIYSNTNELLKVFGDKVDRGDAEIVGAIIVERDGYMFREYPDFRAVSKTTGEIIPDYPLPFVKEDIDIFNNRDSIIGVVDPDHQYTYIFFPIKLYIQNV